MICDDDLVAHRDFVSRMVAELKDPQVGLATATYWSVPGNLPTAMHSLTMATEFFPSVVTAEAMEGGISFALGPASILRRKFLEDLGGFASMANYLAEDYLMGAWGRQKGWRIHLSRESVQIGDHFSSLWDFLVHQLRWSRTYRVCRPFGFFLSVLTQGMFFALLYLVLGGCDPESVMGAIGLVSLRQLAAGLQIMMRGPKRLIFWWWLVPIRDLLSVLFWALSFLGNRVRWRENVFRLSYEGRLEPLDSR
jgi:ceramide glucosyltransferase